MKSNNDELDTLYRQSSQRRKTPSRVRRSVVGALKRKPTMSVVTIFKRWVPLVSAAVVVIFIVGVSYVNQSFNKHINRYTLVDIEHHGFEKNRFKNKSLENKYSTDNPYTKKRDRYFDEYVQKGRSLIVATHRLATVEVLEDEWRFRDCENNLIQLSKQLVAQLKNEARITNNLAIGNHVELALNSKGLILFIEKDNHGMC